MHRGLIFISLVLLQACYSWRIPNHDFGARMPEPPLYANTDHWACLPTQQDACDTVPVARFHDRQDSARADVFFIYPTLYEKKRSWNAAIDDTDLRETLDESTLMHQASLFNGAGRVFVPYYRQMTYYGFWGDSTAKANALQLAYADVEEAFRYYMQHWNQGRPFILAGHSQGGLMTYWLVERLLKQQPAWQEQLVAAYAVGWAIPEGDLTTVPLCQEATQTHCLVTWNTYAWGKGPTGKYDKMPGSPLCVNPLNWRTDTAYAPFSANAGAVGRQYRQLYPQAADAQIHEGYVWIHKDHLPGMAKWLNRFHAADYNLFWANVRQNARDRVDAWYEKQK